MTTAKPRPTRALLDQREQQLHDATRELTKLRAELELMRSEVARADARSEPEADAIALCVAALDAMVADQRAEADRARRNSTSWHVAPYPDATPPSAGQTPVGRVLLYLAARYDVPLAELEPDPEPTPEGDDLVVAPAALARKLERIIRDNPYLLDRLR